METAKSVVDYLLALGEHWPDLLSVVIGWVSGWGLATGVEYFLSENMPAKLQKGVVWLCNVACTTIIGSVVWHQLDPQDLWALYVIGSFGLSFAGAALYPTIARLVTKVVPAVASIYAKPSTP